MSSGLASLSSRADPFAIARDMRYGREELAGLESDWRLWLRTNLPGHFTHEFAPHQADAWEWAWGIRPYERPDPDALICVWSRGGAKSTFAEAACVALGARRRRRYALYVCDRQTRANDHVSTIEGMLGSAGIVSHYPNLAKRALTMFGASKGWGLSARARLRTAIGFSVEALGLDSAARGTKLDEARPDLLIFDDIDSESDTIAATEKKIEQITKKILPAGSARDLAVLVVQNAIIRHGVVSRLAGISSEEDRADFLQNRRVIGPIPALEGLTYEMREQEDGSRKAVITSGEPTWEGQDRAVCQAQVDDWGITAFLSEAQHDVEAPPGGMYDHIEFVHCDWGEWPSVVDRCVWVDPAVTNKDDSDSHGIQADQLCTDGRIYRLFSWERRATPEESMELAIEKAFDLDASVVGVETDQGGDTWITVFNVALENLLKRRPDLKTAIKLRRKRAPAFQQEKAGAGHGSKVHRQSQQLADYETGGMVHVRGTHQILERALKRFPKTKPLDLADCSDWSRRWLRQATGRVSSLHDTRLRGRR